MTTTIESRPLLGKVKIELTIECKTGLHIGAAQETLEIGALDSPVVRDPRTRAPYLPGSSTRGKLRSLLERSTPGILQRNRPIGARGREVRLHVCDSKADAARCPVCRLFGSSTEGKPGENFPSRLLVRDALMTEDSVKNLASIETDLYLTEIKHENALDRLTAHATPRQIERVPAGAQFSGELVYAVEEVTELREDLERLLDTLALLEDDALGGHGARGSGKVAISVTEVAAMRVEDYRRPSAVAAVHAGSPMTLQQARTLIPAIQKRFQSGP